MKTYLFALAFSSLSGLTVLAQDKTKLRNDVTYSTSNYKHPNKATVAQAWTNPRATAISSPVDKGALTSYKQPVPGTEPVGGLVVPHNPQEDLAGRNYKIPRIVSSPAASEVATSGSTPSAQRAN